MKKILFIGILLSVCGFSALANAALENIGGDLIYDTDRDITWYNPNIGGMTWSQAMSWAENLIIGDATEWRLPTAFNQDGSYPLYEYNVTGSEMGHLYYVELGNYAYGPLINTEPFANLQPFLYWSSTTTAQFAGNAFIFNFNNGRQGHADKNLSNGFYALAVHSGNVGPSILTANVSIDIRPWNKNNPINYRKGHPILPVTILSTEDFDAPTQVDRDSLTFGSTGYEQSLAFCNHRPKGRGSFQNDMVCHFYIEVTGFNCGDAEGILKGKTVNGVFIEGRDLVNIIHCK